MKNVVKVLVILFALTALIGCSEEPPSFRVKNERATKANVQIKTVANTINHNDVQPGTATAYQDVAEGKVDITAEIQNENVSPSASFNAANDYNFTIVLVNSNPPTIRIDSEDK